MRTFPVTTTVQCGDKTCCDTGVQCPYLTWWKWTGKAECGLFLDINGNSTPLRNPDDPSRCKACRDAERMAKGDA